MKFKLFSLYIFIGYLIFLILSNFRTLFLRCGKFTFTPNLITILTTICFLVLIYGFIKQKYWSWILAVVVFSYLLYTNIYFVVRLIATGFQDLHLMLINLAANLSRILPRGFVSLVMLLYVVSTKKWFRQGEIDAFGKIMLVFLLLAIPVSVSLEYNSYLSEQLHFCSVPCGFWARDIKICGCEGKLIEGCPEYNCQAWANYCVGKCSDCKCYMKEGISGVNYISNETKTFKEGNEYHRNTKWKEIACE